MSAHWLGAVAATLTTASFLPQAARTLRTRDTGAISLWMYLLFVAGIACWFGYGLVLHSWPMIVSNAITFVLAAVATGLAAEH